MYGGLALELIGSTLTEPLYTSQKKKKSPLSSTPPLNDLEQDKEKAPCRTSQLDPPRHNHSLFKNHDHPAVKEKLQTIKNWHPLFMNQPHQLVKETSLLTSYQQPQYNSLCP
jgi:hypothetical protein